MLIALNLLSEGPHIFLSPSPPTMMQLHAAAQSAEGALGPVDVVICNAGLSLPGSLSIHGWSRGQAVGGSRHGWASTRPCIPYEPE